MTLEDCGIRSEKPDFVVEAIKTLPFICYGGFNFLASGTEAPKLGYFGVVDESMKQYQSRPDVLKIVKQCEDCGALAFSSMNLSYYPRSGRFASGGNLKLHRQIDLHRIIEGGRPHLLSIGLSSDIRFAEGGFPRYAAAVGRLIGNLGYHLDNGLLQLDRDFGALTEEVPYGILTREGRVTEINFKAGRENHLNPNQKEVIERWLAGLRQAA